MFRADEPLTLQICGQASSKGVIQLRGSQRVQKAFQRSGKSDIKRKMKGLIMFRPRKGKHTSGVLTCKT